MEKVKRLTSDEIDRCFRGLLGDEYYRAWPKEAGQLFDHCTAALSPTWTTTRPEKPGWYWWRTSPDDHRPVIVKLARGALGMMLKYGESEWTPIGDGTQWSGPIREPE